ncbi:nuclear transport factor 2 family protein [Rhodococcus sp. TAF43]|uniref:nuclear transport factor 2 family protein n=1 Tax=unclassified Rhodococcus (in: high G+C Gram-positive bacteria) TaxID=192944 RepID=UPI000E0C9235|nr:MULTISPECIES: nuclear transport factor 2 family protein [unclassified Rhodococcus (in: high G+C Gram-positive bacteria)]QKT09576.1 nuclear transport factor 2 family protein [Rhodococcus sp. W8901]RDI12062.1 steroid delta-isomerase [Rhodococcus sp. AG1013]
MPTRDEICSAIDAYVKHLGNHDVDQLVSLFADDAVQHEPLGVRTYRGIDEIREFDTQNAKVAFSVSRHSPIVVSGRYAATQLRVQPEGMPAFLASDLFEFDDACKIVSLSVVLDPEARAD